MKDVLPRYLRKYNALSLRERVLIALISLVVIYLLWNFLLWQNLQQQYESVEAKHIAITKELPQLQKQETDAQSTLAEVSKQREAQLAAAGKTAQSEDQGVATAFSVAPEKLVAPDVMLGVLRELTRSRQGVVIEQLQKMPVETVSGDKPGQLFYLHGIILKLSGSYFTTLAFLEDLERLTWYFSWDKLDYKVADYPRAEITLQFRVLSKQKGWTHE